MRSLPVPPLFPLFLLPRLSGSPSFSSGGRGRVSGLRTSLSPPFFFFSFSISLPPPPPLLSWDNRVFTQRSEQVKRLSFSFFSSPRASFWGLSPLSFPLPLPLPQGPTTVFSFSFFPPCVFFPKPFSPFLYSTKRVGRKSVIVCSRSSPLPLFLPPPSFPLCFFYPPPSFRD